MPATGSPDLILAGFGAPGSLQLTLEAHQAVARVGHVMALGLQEPLHALLRRQSVEIHAMDALLEGRAFAEGYAAIAETVLAEAKARPPALFLSQGNPLFLNAINRYLFVEAGNRGLSVEVYPSVSTIDSVISSLGLDVGRGGLMVISARGLVARPQNLNVQVPALLLEVAGLVANGESQESYGQLVALLLPLYGEDHAVTLLNEGAGGRLSVATVTLGRFAELIPHIDNTSSLFLERRPQPAH
jgi:uncharacterized protein YabN with tetrapyrrole methylase and pyrophosphatase domain